LVRVTCTKMDVTAERQLSMHSLGMALVHNKLATALLVLIVIGFGVAQRLRAPMTIPVLDQMVVRDGQLAADGRLGVGGTGPQSSAVFPPMASAPMASAPAVSPEAPSPSLGDQLLGAIHISSGDAASRPASPTAADPLRVGFSLGAPAAVRVTLALDRGAVVATLLNAPPAPAGARTVEWNGTNTDGSQVSDGRYRLSVEASEDTDVYRKSVRDTYLFVAR
jgi:hypothetical protein